MLKKLKDKKIKTAVVQYTKNKNTTGDFGWKLVVIYTSTGEVRCTGLRW